MDARRGPEPHVIYEFGDFRLDASRRLLFAKGQPGAVAIKPKVLETILYFVEHPNELLDKDRLMDELWPGLVVEENGLKQLISIMRRTLGETPGENRYVATVPGRGYRFVADVVRLSDSTVEPPRAVDPALAPATRAAGGTGPRRRAVLVASILVACVLAVFAYGRQAGWLADRGAARTDSSDAAATELPARTVAVLPFEYLSTDAEHAYMAFGVAESVLHRLAAVQGLTVISRTSSFAASDKRRDVRDIGRALGARYLVEGSVQRAGERLRITAQLVDATTGSHVWSLRFDRTVDDIFAVEDEIAQNVTRALEVSLSSERHPFSSFGTEAYLAYLQGRALVATRRIEDAERAIERFLSATEISPKFAAAYAGLAEAHWHLAYLLASNTGLSPIGTAGRQAEVLAAGAREAQPLLEHALSLDDTLGEAYILRADLKSNAWDIAGAEADYRKGLAFSPSYGAGHQHFAEFLRNNGRERDALAEIDKAILLDPLEPRNYYFKGHLYLFSEETGVLGAHAETWFLKAIELAPDYHPAIVRLGAIRWHQGRFAEAVLLGERAIAIDPRAQWMRWFLVEFYLELGEVDAARSVLADAPDAVMPIRWLTVCLYERKVERAVELLRSPASDFRGFYDQDVPAYVIRDAAIARGDLAGGRAEFSTLWNGLVEPAKDPFRLAALAQMSLALGDRPEAERLARAALELKDWRTRSDTQFRLAYPRAAALMILGQNDAAMAVLEESFDRGYRKRWWYAFHRDPVFVPLRSDPRFRALAEKADAHASAELESLEHMRERGEVPNRSPPVAASADTC